MQYDLMQVRKNMKARKITGVDIAHATEHHPAWVNLCLRGEYPSYGAFGLPRDIYEYLVSLNLLAVSSDSRLTKRASDEAVWLCSACGTSNVKTSVNCWQCEKPRA